MTRTQITLVLGLGVLVFGGVFTTRPVAAATATEACGGDKPLPCLSQHGEAAAQMLAKAYADLATRLDGACAEVIAPGIAACLERAQALADKDLNAAYGRAMGSIANDAAGKAWRERLKASQQAWLRFRDADCGDLVTSEMGSGTGLGAALLGCQLGKTEARTAELNRRYGSP